MDLFLETILLQVLLLKFIIDSIITYIQTDGVAMGSPLGPALADIFLIELEKSLLPELTSYISYWTTPYVS